MKLLFVTYRWGEDLVGGAEIHHRRLVHDLLELGHDVQVWTTTGKEIEPVAHWAVEWKTGYPEGEAVENGVRVRRFPIDTGHRKLLGLSAKFLQRRIEREWSSIDPGMTAAIAASQPEAQTPWVHLLENWHPVELNFEGFTARWTYRESHLALFPLGATGELWISGDAPRPVRFAVRDGAGRYLREQAKGKFDLKFSIHRSAENTPDVISILTENPWRPMTDHRTLGLYVRSIRWMPKGADEPVEANMWNDHRALGRRDPVTWWDLLEQRSARRSPRLCRLFDWLRGPRSAALREALRNPPHGTEAVIGANLPWAILPMLAETCPLPLFVMPLWHIEDDFYWWPHYTKALHQARFVMANTAYAAQKFYAPRGLPAEFVGPGVPLPPEMPEQMDTKAWKREHGIGAHEAIVLSVSRKSPEKRYDTIAEAVEHLNASSRPVRFVHVGPDMDCRVVPPHTLALGRIDDEALEMAYRACDVFVLMSDSESFGMVLAEAWLRGKPVIANRICGPLASLVDEGRDGLLAASAKELAESIASLLDDPQKATSFGEAGRQKARESFTQRAATNRFLVAAERALASGRRKPLGAPETNREA